MIREQDQIVIGGNMAGTILSSGVDCWGLVSGCVQAVCSGAPAGTLTLQFSNDMVAPAFVAAGGNQDPAANVVNWTDDTGVGVKVIAAAGSYFLYPSQGQIAARWMRLKYVPSGGAGSLNATMVAKGS